MKSPTSLIRIRNAVGVMLALSAVFAVVISSVTLTPDRALGQNGDITVTITPPAKSNVEEGKNLVFNVKLSAKLTGNTTLEIPVTVDLVSATSLATDYSISPAPVVIQGDDNNTVKFTAASDGDREPVESFKVKFGTLPTGYVYADGSVTSFIVKIEDVGNEKASGEFDITVAGADGNPVPATTPKRDQKLTVALSLVKDKDYDDPDITGDDESKLSIIVPNGESGPGGEKITYQWKRGTYEIEGATSQSYTPVKADVGRELSVVVEWSDKYGNGNDEPEILKVSSGTLKDPTVNNVAEPLIVVADPTKGLRYDQIGVLTADTSGFIKIDTYEWQRDGVAIIPDGDKYQYRVGVADIARAITVRVTWEVKADGTQTTYTETSAPITPKSKNAPTGKPTISVDLDAGNTLTADPSGISDADGLSNPGFTYQWKRDGVDIAGATSNTYVLTNADFRTGVSVAVSFKDDTGDTETVESEATIVAGSAVSGSGLISRIEPAVRGVTLSAGDKVVLSVSVYGVQDKQDQDLGDDVITWGDASDETGAEIVYTAPSSPGSHDVTATVDGAACAAAEKDVEADCSATIVVRVRRPSAPQPAEEAPVNPAGEIPSILADSAGNQYEVFTPVEGGTFSGEGYSLSVASGAVPNGEFIGIRMSDEGAASNAGMTQQRYTLGGNVYAVSAVDGSGAAVSSYVLDNPATVCVPLPDALRTNISDLAVVALNGNGTLTILSAQVRIDSAGTMVCGGLSSLPATVAVGSAGAPAAIPTATPEPTPEAPDTGGTAPASSSTVLWALLLGIAVFTLGSALVIARRREGSRRNGG